MVLKTNAALLALYEVTYDQVFSSLKQAFRENKIMVITGNQSFIPVILGDKPKQIRDVISRLTVINKNNIVIPLNRLLKEESGKDLKTIIAGQEGEYFPVSVEVPNNDVSQTLNTVRNTLVNDGWFEAGYTGSFFSNKTLFKQLLIIFVISIALLYFILASQFESLTLPLIVLLEIPVDLFGAFLFLKLFGEGINLMSMIGIVVMSGVVINDSILKVDTFNQLMKEGYPLMKALMVGGQRRLKPIVMTALTAILALLPLLFFGGIGADLQKPIALTIIGGMIIGTAVSLFIVPLGYYYLKK
jgi:multidrug efflux pump subunit AcrB